MLHDDERKLLETFIRLVDNAIARDPARVAAGHDVPLFYDALRIVELDTPIHERRAFRLAEKWCDRGWIDYGTSLFSSWASHPAAQSVESMRAFLADDERRFRRLNKIA